MDKSPFKITRVRVSNVKCFGGDGDGVDLSFRFNGDSAPWTAIVGDNAVGKTALLRCIAMGLCDESSAAGLMKESDEGYTRRSSNRPGVITIDLLDPLRPTEEFRITTTISRIPTANPGLSFEQLRQETTPAQNFPWDRVFACAYGMGRGTGGTGDIAGYSVINAVYNLFSYGEGLQNPELTLKRMAAKKQQTWLEQIGRVFEERPTAIRLKDRGISISGKWGGDMPLRDLADGIRATFLWVADFVGWALAFDKSIPAPENIRAIVLVDELEQHLHATWQRRIVTRLREMFPKVQFVVTTHSPVIASSVGPVHVRSDDPTIRRSIHDQLICLERSDEGSVKAVEMPSLRLKRVDQILASRAFKYLIDEDPVVEKLLKTASILAAKSPRTPEDERTYDELWTGLGSLLIADGQTLIERRLEVAHDEELRRRLVELEQRVLGKKE